jgi:ABC-2 type transport system ATP-binding protein
MVEVKDLTKYYGDYAAIESVTFSVNKGEILGFLRSRGSSFTGQPDLQPEGM